MFFKEGIYLKSRRVLDSVAFGPQSTDISLYRCPDGLGNWAYTFSPTFNLLNCNVGIQENSSNADMITIYPNPANTNINLFYSKNIDKLEVYNSEGKKVMQYLNVGSTSISLVTNNLQPGIYFARVNNRKNIKFIIQH